MKYIRTSMTFIMVILAASLTSCSPDTIEEYEDEETQIAEESAPPKPDWADDIVTISISGHQTGMTLRRILSRKAGVSSIIKTALDRPDFPTAKEPGTVDITVITLLEAGFEEPVTLKEIIKRCRKLGYRPLTLEEVAEFRLQFTDQPNASKPHLTEKEEKWGSMFALISEEDAYYLGGEPVLNGVVIKSRYIPALAQGYLVANTMNGEIRAPGLSVKRISDDKTFDPYARDKYHPRRVDYISSFACAIIQ